MAEKFKDAGLAKSNPCLTELFLCGVECALRTSLILSVKGGHSPISVNKVNLKKFSIFVVAGFIPAFLGAPEHENRKMLETYGVDGLRWLLREGMTLSPTDLPHGLWDTIKSLF